MAVLNPNAKVPLSQCQVWHQQREFFDQEGAHAWDSQVPYYVTSNPYIANAYANIIIRFMQDSIKNKKYVRSEPFYIVELGSGSGIFGFYVIKRLLELQQLLGLTEIAFIYVMTDFAEKNIEFWRTHPALQDYLKGGVLDFAVYNAEIDTAITLLNSGKVLLKPDSQKTKANTLMVLANYVFDTISHDVFRVKQGKLQEGLIKESAKIDKTDNNKGSVELSELDNEFSYHDIQLPYYNDKNLDAILSDYQKNLADESCFNFPIGTFRCINNLLGISQQNLLVVATDKGYAREVELRHKGDPDLTLHASFSMMVNFHALGQYFQQYGGDCYHQATRQGITTSVFMLGHRFNQLLETQQAAVTYLDDLGHNNIYRLSRYLRDTKLHSNLDTMLACLSTTFWDPHVFNRCFDVILKKIKSTDAIVIYDFAKGMPKIAENFYYLPGADNTLANIGLFFQEAQDYQQALSYYAQSLCYFSAEGTVRYNMGFCYYSIKNYTDALTSFREALRLMPSNILAREWLYKVELEMH